MAIRSCLHCCPNQKTSSLKIRELLKAYNRSLIWTEIMRWWHDKPCLKRPPERNHQFPLDILLSERKFTASSSIISFSASTSSVVAPRIRRDLPVTQAPTYAKPQKLGTQKKQNAKNWRRSNSIIVPFRSLEVLDAQGKKHGNWIPSKAQMSLSRCGDTLAFSPRHHLQCARLGCCLAPSCICAFPRT